MTLFSHDDDFGDGYPVHKTFTDDRLLSPAALAVFEAAMEANCGGTSETITALVAIAAIRTLVEKTLPEKPTTPMLKEGYEETMIRWSERQRLRAAQLDVADELESKS